MKEVQCTIWLRKNSVLRLGKAVFSKPKSENYTTPNPVKIIPALHWCKERAKIVKGYIVPKGGRIAVFRLMKNNWDSKS